MRNDTQHYKLSGHDGCMALGLMAGQLPLVCEQHFYHLQEGRLDWGCLTAESLGLKPSRTLGRSGGPFPCELLGFQWWFCVFLCFVFLETMGQT